MAASTAAGDIGSLPQPGPRHHQRTKSSVLRSFIGHRRNNSDGTTLPSSFDITPQSPLKPALSIDALSDDMRFPGYSRQPRALEELHYNQQDQGSPRSPKKYNDNGTPVSPTKTGFGTISLKSLGVKDSTKLAKSKQNGSSSPTKPKKSKSATNLAGLLTRPKSMKNLKKEAEEAARQAKDKENRTPPSSVTTESMAPPPPPPIFAQFTSQVLAEQRDSLEAFRNNHGNHTTSADGTYANDPRLAMKQRPKSFQPPHASRPEEQRTNSFDSPTRGRSRENDKKNTWGKGGPATGRSGVLGAFSGMHSRTKSSTSLAEKAKGSPDQPAIDPKDIDTHLEAMLDRRNIPENQRYKMRNLNDTIKMEFIRQDWAESATRIERPGTNDGSDTSLNSGVEDDSKKKKTSRGRTLTLSRSTTKDKDGKDKPPTSPIKKPKGEGTLGRHFRSKSSDSVVSTDGSRPASSSSGSNIASGFLAKVKLQQGPLDYVAYLRKVQKPELVEVGKLHKLRLLLRNETVVWAEEFIREGGMKEIVGLLHRIMEVEWREEHEDALLHENLLCLKALCTTALALQYLNSIHATLFPALLHMIFDPEKKGPSEFTTRNIITSVLLTYIESGATAADRALKAQHVLSCLRDPAPKEDERPLDFVLEMRRERPYRVWCKEVVSVTKEVFWIFLHNLNVVSLVPVEEPTSPFQESPDSAISSADASFMARHFPRPRAPVPAAPYVGGVEWDATNYLASHLDLLNAVIACTPTTSGRNALREEFRVSGWERCLGGSLRLCKEKFYGAVHEGLRTWVAAAAEDGWEVRDVRFGPPPETKSRSVSPVKGGGRKRKEDGPPPRLEMPVLDLGVGGKKDGWLE